LKYRTLCFLLALITFADAFGSIGPMRTILVIGAAGWAIGGLLSWNYEDKIRNS
jgi:hypothetical protein